MTFSSIEPIILSCYFNTYDYFKDSLLYLLIRLQAKLATRPAKTIHNLLFAKHIKHTFPPFNHVGGALQTKLKLLGTSTSEINIKFTLINTR